MDKISLKDLTMEENGPAALVVPVITSEEYMDIILATEELAAVEAELLNMTLTVEDAETKLDNLNNMTMEDSSYNNYYAIVMRELGFEDASTEDIDKTSKIEEAKKWLAKVWKAIKAKIKEYINALKKFVGANGKANEKTAKATVIALTQIEKAAKTTETKTEDEDETVIITADASKEEELKKNPLVKKVTKEDDKTVKAELKPIVNSDKGELIIGVKLAKLNFGVLYNYFTLEGSTKFQDIIESNSAIHLHMHALVSAYIFTTRKVDAAKTDAISDGITKDDKFILTSVKGNTLTYSDVNCKSKPVSVKQDVKGKVKMTKKNLNNFNTTTEEITEAVNQMLLEVDAAEKLVDAGKAAPKQLMSARTFLNASLTLSRLFAQDTAKLYRMFQ